jgi:PPP family 3-phenylpropionic acid transporter
LAACGGIVAGLTSIASGTIYGTLGQGIYYVMALMAALGGLVVWLARDRLSHQPHKSASGG